MQIKRFLGSVAKLLLAIYVMGGRAFADETLTPYAYTLTPPTYTETPSPFDGVTSALVDGALFFGAVAVVAVLITGFFKGRAWFRRV